MLKKIVIGFGLLVLIAVAVIYGNYFVWKAIEDRDAVKKVNEQHAIADIEGDQIFQSRISRLHQLGIIGERVAESKADTERCRLRRHSGIIHMLCSMASEYAVR